MGAACVRRRESSIRTVRRVLHVCGMTWPRIAHLILLAMDAGINVGKFLVWLAHGC
jgi:hypothetical protein